MNVKISEPMKLPIMLLLAGLAFLPESTSAQKAEIVGTWQLVRESTCLEEAATSEEAALRAEMHSRAGAGARVVSFKNNFTAEESTRILNSGKAANTKKFYYKFNGNLLLILDKRSQTISASYNIDQISADSLILSNSARPCEVRIFTKIN